MEIPKLHIAFLSIVILTNNQLISYCFQMNGPKYSGGGTQEIRCVCILIEDYTYYQIVFEGSHYNLKYSFKP